MVGSEYKTIVVCGSGRTLFDDMTFAKDIIGKNEVIAVNGAVYGLGVFEYLASLHHDMIHHWRYAKGLRNDCNIRQPAHACITVSDVDDVDVDRIFVPAIAGGSSALFAVQFAFEALQAQRVILCGVPYDNAGHFYDPPGICGTSPGDWEPWLAAKAKYRNRLWSMSGRTKELLRHD